MTNISQGFNYPELELIINNATEKTITANDYINYSEYRSPRAWSIIVIVLYVGVAGAELIRFWQTRNKLHPPLFVPAALMIAVYAAELTVKIQTLFMIQECLFFFAVVSWMTLIILTHLLSIWVRSMFGRLPARFSRYFFRFVQASLVFFTLTAAGKCIIYVPYIEVSSRYYHHLYHIDGYIAGYRDSYLDERDRCIQELNEYYETLIMLSAIETAIICIMELFCTGILLKFQKAADPKLILKRRQLIWLALMYLTQLVYSVCSLTALTESLAENSGVLQLFVGSARAYISILALLVYFILTISPQEAITEFDKVPSLPTIIQDKPTIIPDQPTVALSQPTTVSDQLTVTKGRFNFMTNQFTVMSGQPTLVTGQLNFVTDQPTVITGRLTFMTDQFTITPGQPIFTTSQITFVPSQPTVASDQPILVKNQHTAMSEQPTIVMGRLNFVMNQFTIMSGQPTSVTGQLIFVTDQSAVITGRLTFATDQLAIVSDQPVFTTSQLIFVPDQPTIV
jgi:hypothetical protein